MEVYNRHRSPRVYDLLDLGDATGRTLAMSVSPSYSLLRILAHVDQKISDAKLISDVPGDDAERTIAITILSDLRDALEEVGQELSASRAKRRTN